jgi:hypothetical protein
VATDLAHTNLAPSATTYPPSPNFWLTPVNLRWRAEWDDLPPDVFSSTQPEGQSVNIHGQRMRVSEHIHGVLEALMRRETPLPLHPVTLTAPGASNNNDGGVEGLLTFRSTHGSVDGWPVKVNLADRQPPADDASASGVLPWIWHDGKWHWLLQVSKSKPPSGMSGQPKIDPMRGKPILSFNDDALDQKEVAVRAVWEESDRVLLLSSAEVAGAEDLDHTDRSPHTSNLFHVRLTAAGADDSSQDISTWLADERTPGSFCHAFRHNQSLLRSAVERSPPAGRSAEEMVHKVTKIKELWICPVLQLMQTMVAMANDYTKYHIVHRPSRGLADEAFVPNEAFVRNLPPSWLEFEGEKKLQQFLAGKMTDGSVIEVCIPPPPERDAGADVARPVAYVTFASESDRDRALELNSCKLPDVESDSFLDIAPNEKKEESDKLTREAHGHQAGVSNNAIRWTRIRKSGRKGRSERGDEERRMVQLP